MTGLLWHAGAFLIVNAMIVLIDLITGGGMNWALWIVALWGFALALHILAYVVDDRQVERRKTVEYMEEEQRIREIAR
jgi:hypothetical protein